MFSRYSRVSLGLLALALYGGPVLAGLAGHGWAVLPVFAALFLLYVAATRKPDLSTPAGLAGLGLMAATQVALVALAWGAGLLIARLTGTLLLPLWAPLGVSAVAAGFGAWAFRDAAEMDVMLDDMLEALERVDLRAPQMPLGAPPSATGRAVEAAAAALRALPRADAALIDPIVRRLDEAAGVEAFHPLYYIAGDEDAPDHDPRIDLGLLRFLARPAILRQLVARGEGGAAPQLLLDATDPGVRAEARALVDDLAKLGAPAPQLPGPAWLTALDAQFPGEGYDLLRARCAVQNPLPRPPGSG